MSAEIIDIHYYEISLTAKCECGEEFFYLESADPRKSTYNTCACGKQYELRISAHITNDRN